MKDYVVFDLEMTGLQVKEDKIIEIGAVKVIDHKVVDTYGMLVNPKQHIPERVTEITGITNAMVADAMDMDMAVEGLLAFIGDYPIVGHNVSFDYSFLKQWAVNHKLTLSMKAVDTLKLARRILPGDMSKRLESLCTYYEIPRHNAHRALDDAIETQQVYEHLMEDMKAKGLPEEEAGELQVKIKKQTPATAHQIERLKEFMDTYHITDDIPWETLTRSQASRIMDYYRSRIYELTKIRP